MAFTYKRDERPTGLAAVAHEDAWSIKKNKKVCGRIKKVYTRDEGILYQPTFYVNGDKGYVTLRKQTKTLVELKEWLKMFEPHIFHRYDIRFLED